MSRFDAINVLDENDFQTVKGKVYAVLEANPEIAGIKDYREQTEAVARTDEMLHVETNGVHLRWAIFKALTGEARPFNEFYDAGSTN